MELVFKYNLLIMESEKSMAPKVYYLREEVDEKGDVHLIVDDKPEHMVPYTSKEVIDQQGRVHIIFWKKSNRSTNPE